MRMRKIMTTAAAGLLLALAACSREAEPEAAYTPPPMEESPDLEGPAAFVHDFPPSQGMEAYGLTDHHFYDVTMAEVLNLREDMDFDGIIYFGFPQCPWCQAAVPVLNEASRQTGVPVFYVSRDPQIREEGNWLELDQEMARWLDNQFGLQWLYEEGEDGEDVPVRPNIFVPQVIHLRRGEVVDHYRGTFEEHLPEDGVLPELTERQHEELLQIYLEIFRQVEVLEDCPLNEDTPSTCS